MENKTVICASPEDTMAFGRELAKNLKRGSILLLYGAMGMGKTLLTKGIAEGLGITQPVTSPTYQLLESYDTGRLTLNHFDLYRLDSIEQILAIGFEDIIYSDGVSVIEWPERLGDFLPEEYIRIDITKGAEGERVLAVSG